MFEGKNPVRWRTRFVDRAAAAAAGCAILEAVEIAAPHIATINSGSSIARALDRQA